MRRLSILTGLLVLSMNCASETHQPTNTETQRIVTPTVSASVTYPLTAGQNIAVGTVTIENDGTNVYVIYDLDYDADNDGNIDAAFGTLHVWAGTDLGDVPSNNNGIPVPGQFCNVTGGACYDADGSTNYTFTISLAELGITDPEAACGQTVYVVTHAEVGIEGEGGTQNETAFGGDIPGEGNRWWFYSAYPITCDDDPEPEPEPTCETAFAKGNYVWTTGPKSNPEGLPSLELTQNRWGWAIELTETGDYTYDVYAGAGLNDTTKGTLVGQVDISWDGSDAYVGYSTLDGFEMTEVHIYAADEAPSTIAPGQYGHTAELEEAAASYSTVLDLSDADSDGVWFIAHAVVCGDFPASDDSDVEEEEDEDEAEEEEEEETDEEL